MIRLTEWIEHFILLPNGKPLKLELHQRAILDHCFAFDQAGKLPYDVIVYSCPKKSGKTEINADVLAYWAFNVEAPNEIITVANKRDQAIARGFKRLKEIITQNPILFNEIVGNTVNQLTLRNGSSLLAIPNDFAGEAGSNHGLTTWDELWGFTTERDRRLYEELTPVPTRKNSIRFITTYAGFTGESQLLEELYHEIFADDGSVRDGVTRPLGGEVPCYAKAGLFVYWENVGRMSWQTPEYYQAQRRQLRLNTYLRLHENRWVSSESSMFDMDKWDACVDPEHRPPLPDKRVSLWVGVDASVKKDRSAVVSVYREGGKIKLGPKRFWQPSAAEPMDLEETMEKYLLELHMGYTLLSVKYDPFQFHRSAMTLTKKGLPMAEYPQTVPNLTEIGQNLFDLVQYRNLVLYPCKDLRFEASCAIGKETGRGIRIAKEKSSQKIDEIVALAMAALDPSKGQDGRLIPEFSIERNTYQEGGYEHGKIDISQG
jgi:phage terminase large subunit-like protein